ncbi:hypothetical protein MKY34_18465 [Sporosarcina sp. FSL K6-1522]|uniref:hypothetical protein n=1 Tax=Sporosarcina sp. FSL K6-1522 TaxID=2921554 RepID=UPI00315A59AA
MIWIFLVFLFTLQIIGFYFIALLYTKIAKFDELEKKQRKLMAEMDDSLVAYLSELKDENEWLIERLATREDKPIADKAPITKEPELAKLVVPPNEQPSSMPITKPQIPINVALRSYGAANKPKEQPEVEADDDDDDDRTRAFAMHDAGESIEEIAKKLRKGRTEVELLLKFR